VRRQATLVGVRARARARVRLRLRLRLRLRVRVRVRVSLTCQKAKEPRTWTARSSTCAYDHSSADCRSAGSKRALGCAWGAQTQSERGCVCGGVCLAVGRQHGAADGKAAAARHCGPEGEGGKPRVKGLPVRGEAASSRGAPARSRPGRHGRCEAGTVAARLALSLPGRPSV
jgi:hypothetical protein